MKFKKLLAWATSSQIWRSVFRHGRPDTPRTRSLIVTSNLFLHVHPAFVRRHVLRPTYTWGLGVAAFVLFLILSLSGVLLMFYYVPDVNRAYSDMKDLRFAVPFGMFLRNIHRWSAHAMVLVVIFHMLRVFYTASYRPPRQFNWVIGVMLLVLTLLLSFTGYLLPWDQLAYWAVTVGANMAASAPVIGHNGPFHELLGARVDNDIRFMLLGGTEVGQNALIRFYVLHCLALPALMCVLLAVHFWRIRKDGGLSRPGELPSDVPFDSAAGRHD
ncbi:MAG: cytochrome b N-terminal domain-containing protein [Planctomycetes bacterium]|nr:cytochrome b N-terminal domain-containing protein [Planctomycetota bacterium]